MKTHMERRHFSQPAPTLTAAAAAAAPVGEAAAARKANGGRGTTPKTAHSPPKQGTIGAKRGVFGGCVQRARGVLRCGACSRVGCRAPAAADW